MSAESFAVTSVPLPDGIGPVIEGWDVHDERGWRREFFPDDVDGIDHYPRRPLALLHANPAHTAWVRLRHFEAAVDRIGARHADVLFGSDEALALLVLGDHLDATYAAALAVRR